MSILTGINPETGEEVEHRTLKATTTELDQEAGTFTAYASAFGNVDRTGERVIRGAFRDTIKAWQLANRDLPLVWDHGRDARDVIGSVDSSSMEERDAGLFIEASLDIEDSELAREAWRSVKKGRVSLSFGYVVEEDREGPDGVKELTRLDLMEVTLTSVPANPSARVLDWKSTTAVEEEEDEEHRVLPPIEERRYDVFGIEMNYQDMVTLGPRIAKQRQAARKSVRPVDVLTFDLSEG